MLVVEDLNKSYSGGRAVISNVGFRLADDETLAVVGPSGCGKTTLLYLLCGLAAPDSGRIEINGRPVRRPLSELAIILQDYGLLPWKTVINNVALGMKIQGIHKRQRLQAARQVLLEMGLAGREEDYPACLSGGEQQRVAIARAYAQKPRLLLMDEPFSSLDAITREKLQNMLVDVRSKTKTPYILVTHSVEEAVFLGRRILILAGEPAGVKAEFDNPGFGSTDYRSQQEYFDLVQTIRRAMEKHW